MSPDLCLCLVFIADTGKEVFVWVGKRASDAEKKNGLTYAHVSWHNEGKWSQEEWLHSFSWWASLAQLSRSNELSLSLSLSIYIYIYIYMER